MLVFEERGKLECPEKKLSEKRREPTTTSTHIWRRCRDLNPGNIGGRRALSPLCHPLLPSRVGAKSRIPPRNLVFFQIQLRNFKINNIVSNIFNQLICEFQVANIKCKCIQLFWERLSEKGHMTIPKGIEGSLECTVLQRNLKESHWRLWTYVWEY